MSISSLETALRNLPAIGTLVKDRPYRQVWRFEHDGRAYYLKFYPRMGFRDRFRRYFRGSPALGEFQRLQALQKARVPAPRAVASLLGFILDGQVGDAVILEAIEPSVSLDAYLTQLEANGKRAPDHRHIVQQLIDIVHTLAKAKLGHKDLHLGNFILHDGKLLLLDGYSVRDQGMKLSDLLMLGHSARRFATRTDLLRGWNTLGPGGPMLKSNRVSKTLWRNFIASIWRNNRYFGRIQQGEWTGHFFRQSRSPQSWSAASQLSVPITDWQREWPILMESIQNDTLQIIKRRQSGDVLGGTVTLGGQLIDVIIKRPRRRYWYRYLNEIGRGTRPARAWSKSWQMIARGLPVAWPMLVMEKRVAGYVMDAVFVCQRVPGPHLGRVMFDELSPNDRRSLLHRTGSLLREIERLGYSHFDAKASNWIVLDTPAGPCPVMIDIDGIRHRRWTGLGIGRLLRSLQENPQYTPADSLALCQGYAPWSSIKEPTIIEKTSVVEQG